ncbi:MAG TPA: 16S rRNA (guanine(527)-N(7))-methyltransferase RsmG [Firmicutes bacterium]|nr:16S rRNA (guanine(527)-N(7))-methyltransferase RsmG [Bacillota bacterium]
MKDFDMEVPDNPDDREAPENIGNLMREGVREAGIPLGEEKIGIFARYYQELVKWNGRANLIGTLGPEEVVFKHFIDSLLCWRLGGFEQGIRLLDVGAGAGFPGVPLKIMFPEIELVALEATRKKVDFLRHILAVLGLGGGSVIWGRAEDHGARGSPLRENFDRVVARAVARLPILVEYCLPFVKCGGIFIAFKGPLAAPEVSEAGFAVEQLGGRVREVVPASLPRGYGERNLVIIEKIRPSPGRFPRRPGIPEKRPIRCSGGRN